MVQNLLNPDWGPQVYDTGQLSAEDAVALGIPGSNLANYRGARRYADQLTKNALTASNLLSAATGRLPQPFDVSSQLLSPAQQAQISLQAQGQQLSQYQLAQQAQLERERMAQQLLLEQMSEQAAYNRALLGQRAAYGGGRGYGGGGAGYGASVSGPSTQGPYISPNLYPSAPATGGYGVLTQSAQPVQSTTDYGPLLPNYGWGATSNTGGDWWGGTDWLAPQPAEPSNYVELSSANDWWNQPLTDSDVLSFYE